MQNTIPQVSTVTSREPFDSRDRQVRVLPVRRISWPAIIAGAVIALAIQFLLAMLGTGIDASTVDPLVNGESPSAGAFGMGAAVWWGVSSLIALYFGGWIAGRLSGMPRAADGGLHGLLAWALSLLATVYLVSTTATVGAAAAPKVADAAGEQLSKAGISLDSLKREAMQVLSQSGKPVLLPGAVAQQAATAVSDVKQTAANPVANDQDFSSMIERILKGGKDSVSQVDKEVVVNVVVARTGLSRGEATARVDGWMVTADQARVKAAQVAEQAKQKARKAADATAKGVSRGMLLGSLALALGALAAFWGGSMGQRREVAAVVLPA